jgi:hypothetical protein
MRFGVPGSAAKPALRRLNEALLDERVLSELHQLIWTEPFVNQAGRWDLGWSCQLGALMGAVLASMVARCPTHVIWGEATFIRGPMSGEPPHGIAADPCVVCHR